MAAAANSTGALVTVLPSPTLLDVSTFTSRGESSRRSSVEPDTGTPNISRIIKASHRIPPILERRPTVRSAATSRLKRLACCAGRTRRREPAPGVQLLEVGDPRQQAEEGSPVHRGEIKNIKPNREDILKAVCSDSRSASDLTSPGTTTTDNGRFPVYDDLSTYLVTEDQATTLLKLEIDRLVEVVENPRRPLRFSDAHFLNGGFQAGHQKLSTLSHSLLNTIYICSLDNDAITMKCNNSRLVSKHKISECLRSLSQQPTATTDWAEAQNEATSSASGDPGGSDLGTIYSLIDYVTAILARLMTQSAYGDYWHNNTLGVLAKWVAKAKVLLRDLPTCSSIALENVGSMLDGTEGLGDGYFNEDEYEGKVLWNEKLRKLSEDAAIREYCRHQRALRRVIETVLSYIFVSLRYLDSSGLPLTSYDVCAIVYETGFEGFKALLFQDRDHQFSATSDLNNLNIAHSAFDILNQSLCDLRRHRGAPPGRGKTVQVPCATVEWRYSEGEEQGHQESAPFKVELSNMEDIITVMVPLAATTPAFLASLNNFKDTIYLSGDIGDEIRPYAESKFDASFRMFTSDFDNSNSRGDALRLSQAVSGGLFSRDTLIYGERGDNNLQRTSAEGRSGESLQKITEDMGVWIYEESSVIVNCPDYVLAVLIAATCLVSGGLAIGFTVQTRLKGVDPFNITTYAWILAAFVVLVCKSMRVDEWSWRDFLLGRVRCRCVTELEVVTGIGSQLIMAKLLHDESRTNMITRGPYNAVFKRKSQDGSGFSIDRPLSTQTMLLSGLTLLKVMTPTGHALVCLDGRRGTDIKVVEHRKLDDKEHLVCEDITRPQLQTLGQTSLPLRESKTLKWRKVQGVYNNLDAVFV
ncbi:hypothetical protein C7212DRAFT_284973 [Tuber magnatum]|uniref:Uncharacterized protein n=1 Tax=Tuber magnatum TaxID=42249 RepID=A0A317SIS5_9PEZI|nr:hypothetical protein C7212DRAFT_284973 [Tuber magnatum]